MNFLSRSASIIAKGSISLVGVAGLAALIAAPASAQTASISGAMTRTSPAGFITSVSAEMVAPEGVMFTSPVTVTGTIPDADNANLTLSANWGTVPGLGAPSMLESEVIRALNSQDLTTEQGIDAYAAILKAAVGSEGLDTSSFGYAWWD
ncbi:hypothetical protein [Leptolyngbya sp. NIES-2104]|uniref:hypothetical protein n=1 Tax=Leptolyngbya sp. NIES-2104 TaxID=1552121 RepID=UPI0006EC970B|nr:hypothetical protein [Leptolyngbya sp. NIES-2104]GAP95104.1 hypothetical protein NIES2104_16240 [Leptolyngbya sp. NIES-2104]